MATCDICGKELGDRSEKIQLYSAHVTGREVKGEGIEAYTAPKIATSYKEKPRQVSVTVCSRHRFDLLKQRVLTGFFVFILVYLPVLFIFGKTSELFGLTINYQVWISMALSIIAVFFIVRIIRYDSLVAVRMTTKSKMEKSDLEYMTNGKYHKMIRKARRHSPNPGR